MSIQSQNTDIFFQRTHHPYYISAPTFRQTSAGVRALHYLCHMLNELGYEAYVTSPPDQCSPYLRTPTLSDEIVQRHRAADLSPIAVYPEVVTGNPLGVAVVSRWLLNLPGHLGGENSFPAADLIFHYRGVILNSDSSDRLDMPLVDRRIFNNNTPEAERNGFAYYAAKYLHFQNKISRAVISNPRGTSLALNIPRSHQEIADILRRSEAFYIYEPSTMIYEALACGCPVAYVNSPYLDQFSELLENAAIKIPRVDESEIDKFKVPAPPTGALENFLLETERNSLEDIENFIKKTQAAAKAVTCRPLKNAIPQRGHEIESQQKPVISGQPALTKNENNYLTWQSKRSITAEEIRLIEEQVNSQTYSLNFHLILRLAQGDESGLADTLDSLSGQFHPHWHLDIVTDLPPPEGLEEISCIDWHTTDPVAQKSTIDSLVDSRGLDWCIEIPPGARLDPLYLWRLSVEIFKAPDVRCFFVDDDCFDDTNKSFAPRFKPGANPSALESSDLAGPLCVSPATWNSTGGTSENAKSPWFGQLLRIARQYGWNSIQHIPDVLISYPKNFPSDPTSCAIALLEHLDYQKTKTEIIPVSGESWCFRHPLQEIPLVSIAIISDGRLDLLARCFDSIIHNTDYPQDRLERLVVLNQFTDDADLAQWLTAQTQREQGPITVVLDTAEGNIASRCNKAVRSASGELVLLLDEEATVTTPDWLRDLVGTCIQPTIAGVSPCLVRPGANTIYQAGLVLGMTGIVDYPGGASSTATQQSGISATGLVANLYEENALHGNQGYLNLLRTARDVGALSCTCMLVRKNAYLDVGGMDENRLGNTLADVDLSLKLRQEGWRLVYQPLATVEFGDIRPIPGRIPAPQQAEASLAKACAIALFQERWWPAAAIDPYWNRNLSLRTGVPQLETNYRARWDYLPMSVPRILARPLNNGQGTIRLGTPLETLRKAGLAQTCVYLQTTADQIISPAELIRLAADSVIVHHYVNNRCLDELASWHAAPGRPFLIYEIDDLFTELDETNPFKKNIPPDSRTRLKQALKHCNRLVVSTDYLAERYGNLIPDVRVIPNYLEQSVWLPLQGTRRTSAKPRIGWAGGTTHLGDLVFLKEIIEQTRHEADWIFFGMCPEELRPLVTEYHPLIALHEYPAYLASLNLDIAVAPLAQTPFNRGKSNLRLLEYGILGLPVVCTDIDPYQNSPACCVKNTPAAWLAALRERIYDADAREREGLAMREWVRKHYLLENNLHQWLDTYLPG